MVKIEQRKEERILAEDIPKKYQIFTVSLENGETINVKCIDVSKNGFSFITELSPECFLSGTKIVLHLSGIKEPLYGIIVSSDNKKNHNRKSVLIQSLGGYDKYQTIFNIIYHKLHKE